MASPPSNYNPEVSMFSGGTSAQILPVQGGGSTVTTDQRGGFMSTPPAGFNPSASLLNGGDSVSIQAIRGGGGSETDPTETTNPSIVASTATSGSSTPKINKTPNTSIFQVNTDKSTEIVPLLNPTIPPTGPSSTNTTQQSITTTEPEKLILPSILKKKNNKRTPNSPKKGVSFINQKESLLALEEYALPDIFAQIATQSFNNTKKIKLFNDYVDAFKTISFFKGLDENDNVLFETKTDSMDGPLFAKKNDPKFLSELRRKAVIINAENPHIWVASEVAGDVNKLQKIINLIPKENNLIKKDQFLVITEGFFSKDNKTNKALFELFLDYKLKNKDNIFLLVERNEDFKNAAANLVSEVYPATNDKKDKLLFPYLEPDILVFKGLNLIITGGTLYNAAATAKGTETFDVSIRTLVEDKSTPSQFSFNPSPTKDSLKADSPSAKIYKVIDYEQEPLDLKTLKPEITCPEGDDCSDFVAGYFINNIILKKIIGKNVFLLYKNKDKLAYLKEDQEGELTKQLEELSKEEEKTEEEGEEGEEGEEEEEEEVKEIPFTASKDATVDVDTISFSLNFKNYSIRNPEREIQDEWSNFIFTKDEVKFLSDLNITSTILGVMAKDKNILPGQLLSEFLTSVGTSDCYHDNSLLTQPECFQAKEFIKDLYYTKLKKSLKDYKKNFFSYLKTYMETTKDTSQSTGTQTNIVKIEEQSEVKPEEVKREEVKIKEIKPVQEQKEVQQEKDKTVRENPLTLNEFIGDMFGEQFLVYYDTDKKEYFADIPILTDKLKERLEEIPLKELRSKELTLLISKIQELMGEKDTNTLSTISEASTDSRKSVQTINNPVKGGSKRKTRRKNRKSTI